MRAKPDFQSVSQPVWDGACEREAVIRHLAQAEQLSPEQVEAAAMRLGLSCSSVYRLVARFKRRPTTSSLLPAKAGRPGSLRLLAPRVETIIEEAIQSFYLTPQRPGVIALMRDIRRRCEEQKLNAPSFRSVRRRLAALDPRVVTQARRGARAAQQQYEPVGRSPFDGLLPLELVQIDHAQLDVIVVDEGRRRTLGRPWLTLAIDVASRVVTGFYVSLDAPAAVSVALVLTQAVLPKDLWLADRQLDLSWPVAGIPERLHLDNAPEFNSQALGRGAQEYGIALEHRPPQQPHFGGHIERLIGTVMGEVHLLPGTTFSSVAERGAYRPQQTARLTLAEVERWLALQIVGVYHHSVHSALHRPPIQAWTEGLERRGRPPRQPVDAETFFLDFLPGERRLIRRDGLRLFNIHYWANVLSPLAGRTKALTLVKYDPRNLSRVFWKDKQGHYWPVPYRDLGLPPISLWEHRQAVRELRAQGRRGLDQAAIFAAVLEQRKILDALSKPTARQRQQRARRAQMPNARPPTEKARGLGPASPPEPEGIDYSKLAPFEVEDWSDE
jgi:putative transposase